MLYIPILTRAKNKYSYHHRHVVTCVCCIVMVVAYSEIMQNENNTETSNMTTQEFIQWRLSIEGEPRTGKTHEGLSQSEAAQLLGVSPRTVQSWESGGRPIPQYIQHIIAVIDEAETYYARLETPEVVAS